MGSWDEFVAALGALPLWHQYRLQLQFTDMVNTKLQLAKFGVRLPPSTTETEN